MHFPFWKRFSWLQRKYRAAARALEATRAGRDLTTASDALVLIVILVLVLLAGGALYYWYYWSAREAWH